MFEAIKKRLSINRGIQIQQNDQILGIDDDNVGFWTNANFYTNQKTPILEMIFNRIAIEFAKLKLDYIKVAAADEWVQRKDSPLYEVLTLRPNGYQSISDWLYVMNYQKHKFGNGIALVNKDYYKGPDGQVRSRVKDIIPLNVDDYIFGNGYQLSDGSLWLKLKKKSDNEITLLEYSEIIHVRLNPNDVFYGDQNNLLNSCNGIVKLFDENLNMMMRELSKLSDIQGVVTLGAPSYAGEGSNITPTIDDMAKIKKSKEIKNRIEKSSSGIIVLDAGESWKELQNNFEVVSESKIKQTLSMLYKMYGVSEKVIDGTATSAEMEIFFNQTVSPDIKQFMEELNYKLLSKKARTQGNNIINVRNPFEYVSITDAADAMYKTSHLFTKNQILGFYNLAPAKGGDEPMVNLNFVKQEDLNTNKKGGTNGE